MSVETLNRRLAMATWMRLPAGTFVISHLGTCDGHCPIVGTTTCVAVVHLVGHEPVHVSAKDVLTCGNGETR